jgi:hypothetical protein
MEGLYHAQAGVVSNVMEFLGGGRVLVVYYACRDAVTVQIDCGRTVCNRHVGIGISEV